MSMRRIEDELRKELADPRDTVIIVGAGVTIGALQGSVCQTRASWAGLIRHGLEHAVMLGTITPDVASALTNLLSLSDPNLWISAAERVSAALGAPEHGEFRRWLRDALEPFASSIQDRSALEALAELQRRGATLATVNYDGLLEAVTGLPPVTWRDKSEVDLILNRRANGILHLHGYWARPETIVLGTTSYAQVVGDEYARTVLTVLRAARMLVYVGHGAGLGDPNWKSFLDWTAKVFHGSVIRHYRIVLESDMEALRDPDDFARRIHSVPYPGSYANLGPFLHSLVPNGGTERTTASQDDIHPATRPAAVRHVLLLLNIGNKSYTRVTAKEVKKFAELPEIAEVHEVDRVLELASARARDWREIAQMLDALLQKAHESALDSPEPVTFVIAGRAPLPVFAYLGYKTKRLNGRVLIVNQQQGGTWDRIGPFSTHEHFPQSRRIAFTNAPSTTLSTDPGKVGLFVGCSSKYRIADRALEPVAQAESQPLHALHRIEGAFDHLVKPLDQTDLAMLASAYAGAQADMDVKHARRSGVILAVAGPVWVAFWLGRMMNTNVTSLIDFPNYVQGVGYRRALASRMEEMPWVHGSPRILALAAEPRSLGVIHSRESLEALHQAIETARGPEAERHVVSVEATRASELVAILERSPADILHIYAHGNVVGGIGLVGDDGQVVVVGPDALIDALRSTNARASLVVIFACHAAVIAPILLGIAEVVVATDHEVQSATAIAFIRRFYETLARGESVARSFHQAKADVALLPGHSPRSFVLAHRADVDPEDAVYW